MDKCMVIGVCDLFSLHQQIKIVDENNDIRQIASVLVSELPETLINTCKEYGYNDILLLGDKYTILEEYRDDIYTYAKTQYGKDDLNIIIQGDTL